LRDNDLSVAVEEGDNLVVIRRRGISRPSVATILKREENVVTGEVRLLLDRLVHKPHETKLGKWGVSGAYVSVLIQHK